MLARVFTTSAVYTFAPHTADNDDNRMKWTEDIIDELFLSVYRPILPPA